MCKVGGEQWQTCRGLAGNVLQEERWAAQESGGRFMPGACKALLVRVIPARAAHNAWERSKADAERRVWDAGLFAKSWLNHTRVNRQTMPVPMRSPRHTAHALMQRHTIHPPPTHAPPTHLP